MSLRYYLGAMASIPLLPIMYYQGKRIRASVPILPEASGNEGVAVFKEQPGSRKIRLVTIGESTIAGVGVKTHEEGFSGELARQLSALLQADVEWKVYARSGYTTKNVWQRILPSINETGVDLVVVGLGGNDAFTLNTPKGWERDVLRLINSIRHKIPKAHIVFCNMPPIKEFPAFTPLIKGTIGNLVEIFGEKLLRIVGNYEDVHYSSEIINFENWTGRLPEGVSGDYFCPDGVHPSGLTYQIWAKDIARYIHEAPPIRESLLK